MLFSSPLFIFIFLPVVLSIYYLLPRNARNGFLLVANLVFYGWGEPTYIAIMVVSIAGNYLFGLGVNKYRSCAKAILVASIAFNLILLGFFKYTNFFANLASTVFAYSFSSVPQILLPIGISFYTFQAMSYVVDVYRKDTFVQRNIITFGTYISLFPQLIAGPIVRYRDVAEQLSERRENVPQFADGVRLFLIGLAKKVLLANQMGILWEAMKASPDQNGILGSWVGIVAFAFQIYFDFSGYSDMARGLGKMFGFEFMVNFRYPYISRSITEFWRRWHISLSSWFRDYVYIPMGGSRKGNARTILNLLIVWSLTGFWHGANYNFILWGLYYAAILIAEKFLLANLLDRAPSFLAHLYAAFLILIGWVIFSIEDLPHMVGYLSSLFSFDHGFFGDTAQYYTRMYLPLLVVSAFACLPVGKRIYEKAAGMPFAWVLEVLALSLVMVLCTSALVSQSYNPFLYFRF